MHEPSLTSSHHQHGSANVKLVPRHQRLGMAELHIKDNIKPVEISHPISKNQTGTKPRGKIHRDENQNNIRTETDLNIRT
ncbi:hypothetical protein RHMOL_Rhmol12G0017400 [Rhododendron molle]|uniref:Uncharacterized protein n=1 Tax=Rhododendron molle TaxID=49168 RepID=A0ACC0LEH8_RHOML|nr:hypothetical protein RHMOL_Rhmol12G0017400 [Rhododendron molle]